MKQPQPAAAKRCSKNLMMGQYPRRSAEAGNIVGYVSGGPQRENIVTGYDCELYNLFVMPEFQGQGIGSALFERLLRISLPCVFSLKHSP
jgi:ribosomal protein S18 acetylase RimI-like enzyme